MKAHMHDINNRKRRASTKTGDRESTKHSSLYILINRRFTSIYSVKVGRRILFFDQNGEKVTVVILA
jgi:hypothetical protein